MLVLSRHRDESLIITHPDGTRIVVTVVDIRGDKIRLGVAAPMDVIVDRAEIDEDKRRAKAGIGGVA